MMRLHTLSVTAFGPFVDTAVVDFDALSSAGLFLLSGATGAGKTSVLDAVCFALYGDVPGDRSVAKRLRSDQAPPGVAPEVTLEVTLAGRQFRLVRSPSWLRPKKRGSGNTQQQASITLTERTGDEWTFVSNRLDEVGDLITHLVGMNLTQFCQVAMLPQGRFQAFLRARADERQAVLQQLFHTSRFARVEGWLRDHRLELHRHSRRLHETVLAQVNRLSEAASLPPPEEWDLQALDMPAADGSLIAWALELQESCVAAAARASGALPGALEAEAFARRRLEEAARIQELQSRHQVAVRAYQLVESRSDVQAARIAEIDGAQRAAAVSPLIQIAERAAWEASAARIRVTAAREELRAARSQAWAVATLGSVSPDADTDAEMDLLDLMSSADSADTLEADLQAKIEDLGELRGSDERVGDLHQAVTGSAQRLEEARTQARDVAALTRTLPTVIRELRTSLDSCRQLADSAEVHQSTSDVLQSRLEAHAVVEHLTSELRRAKELRSSSRVECQDLTEVWLDLREARLLGMAAEIAGALAVGGSCPVCGSCSHPHRASPAPGAPDAVAERTALRAVDDAKATLHLHEAQVHQITTRLAVARAAAGGGTPSEVAQLLEKSQSDLQASVEADARAQELARDITELEEQLSHAQQQHQQSEREISRCEEQHRQLVRDLDVLSTQRAAALSGTGLGSVSELLERLRGLQRLGSQILDLQVRADEADRRRCEHERSLTAHLLEHGFDEADAATAAHRDEATLASLRHQADSYRREESRCLALLADPELVQAAASPRSDLDHLTALYENSREAAQVLRTQSITLQATADRLSRLVDELAETLQTWRPVRERHQQAADLSAFAEGKSVDNRLQMRLSAYVLSYRLSQVVAAANLRLAGMSGQRYSLEHTGQRGNRESRGGLGLLVRDDWSGEARDPATLSGGETFVVSLALALGLADVITEEAGGADLDTLFVDEGFGSLDADTLDDVLDTLDALRDGGRVVGVVSHVTEMRERIPTQLRVMKSRKGSTLATVSSA